MLTAIAHLNSFSNRAPAFPYESDEARRSLGLPDSAVVHLAVTDLAETLLRSICTTELDREVHRVAALRTASGAALYGWTLTTAQNELLQTLNLPRTAMKVDYGDSQSTCDWLSGAAEKLRNEGVPVASDNQRHRNHYGWQAKPVE